MSGTSVVPECRFWKSSSTWILLAIRLAVLLLPQFGDFPPQLRLLFDWIFNPSFTFLFVKPTWTLDHVREARAIQKLVVGGRFSYVYLANQSIRLPPLLLKLTIPLLDCAHPEIWLGVFLLLADLGIAGMLEVIGIRYLFSKHNQQEEEEQDLLPEAIQTPCSHIFPTDRASTKSLLTMEALPLLAARLYFWSPFSILSGGVYQCFQSLPSLAMLASLYECVTGGSHFLSTFYLALASYLEIYSCSFLVPLVLLRTRLYPSEGQTDRNFYRTVQLSMTLSFLAWFTLLQGLSWKVVGSNVFVETIGAVYGCGWINAAPSLSVQWYFAEQMFSRFREYFEALMLGLPYIMIVPLTTRLYKYPLELIAIIAMIGTIFRPVQTLFDMNMSLCFYLFCPRSLARMSSATLIALISIWVPILLMIVDHWMWLVPNTGNPNYLYFQCLAYNVFLGVLLVQLLSASLQRDKALRLASKERSNGD